MLTKHSCIVLDILLLFLHEMQLLIYVGCCFWLWYSKLFQAIIKNNAEIRPQSHKIEKCSSPEVIVIFITKIKMKNKNIHFCDNH